MKIIVIQPDILWEQPKENYKKIEALLNAKTIPKDSLIVLPEMFDTGFSMNLNNEFIDKECHSIEFLKKIALKYQSHVIGGYASIISSGNLANCCEVINGKGLSLLTYQKMHPFSLSGEDKVYLPGDKHYHFDFCNFKISPFICYDLRFPEVFRTAVKDGVNFFIVIANWPAKRSEHWFSLLKARAIENQAYVLGVNRCGSDPNVDYEGGSVLYDPLGECVQQLDENEDLVNLEINYKIMKKWRASFPALNDAKHLK
jgi:omega-amidase